MPALKHLFSTAVRHHRTGNSGRAEKLSRRVLDKSPGHAGAIHLLGVIACEAGNYDLAAALIGRAIQIRGPEHGLCTDLGRILSRTGKHRQAIACYRQALDSGASRETVSGLLGRAHFDLGNELHQAGRRQDAEGQYQLAVEYTPGNADAWYNLGVLHMMENRLAPAEKHFSRALALKPDYAQAHNNLGIIHQALGNSAAAAESYRRAAGSDRDSIDARYNLAVLRQSQDEPGEAIALYDEVLSRHPAHAEAHSNRGNAQLALANTSEAAACYERALQCDPNHDEARWNLALAQLLRGDYKRGFAGYEHRLAARPLMPGSALWDGSPLNGQRLLVRAEQGLGDTLQFIRFLPLVKAMGAHTIVECQPALYRLLERTTGIDELVPQGSPLPVFDRYLWLMSLPHLLGIGLDTLPSGTPYVHTRGRASADRFRADALNVGLVWAGNPKHKYDSHRSMHKMEYRALLDIPGVRVHNLQKDAPTPDGMMPLAATFSDFEDTANAVDGLDLVISVDTAVAHLAGALGKPVWTLVAYAPDWRWLLDREDSPWYPSMRIFRQRERGNWNEAIARVRTELETLSQRS